MQGKLVSKLKLGPFLTLSVRNGPSVSFGTKVPCNVAVQKEFRWTAKC